MQELNLLITGDGSHTLYHSGKNENYHSIHGAIQETRHVFINQGLKKATEIFSGISILEIGFGTGLNALLTLEFCSTNQIAVDYVAIEPFPLSDDLVKALNYSGNNSLKLFQQEFLAMHTAVEGSTQQLTDFFKFTRYDKTFQAAYQDLQCFNLIYFDAFSPDTEPDLWVPEIFMAIRNKMISNGIFVTYSARGSVRRALQSTGYVVERLPGPPGKREMLRATAK